MVPIFLNYGLWVVDSLLLTSIILICSFLNDLKIDCSFLPYFDYCLFSSQTQISSQFLLGGKETWNHMVEENHLWVLWSILDLNAINFGQDHQMYNISPHWPHPQKTPATVIQDSMSWYPIISKENLVSHIQRTFNYSASDFPPVLCFQELVKSCPFFWTYETGEYI